MGLPKPEAGQKMMKIGRKHGGRVPETWGLASGGTIGALLVIEIIK
jgi:hypothetical protein